MSERDDYEATMESELERWTTALVALETDPSRAVDEPYRSLLSGWRKGGDAARAKLAELRASSGNRWEVVRPQMARAWAAIASVLEDASAGTAIAPGSIDDTNASTRITLRAMAVVLAPGGGANDNGR